MVGNQLGDGLHPVHGFRAEQGLLQPADLVARLVACVTLVAVAERRQPILLSMIL